MKVQWAINIAETGALWSRGNGELLKIVIGKGSAYRNTIEKIVSAI